MFRFVGGILDGKDLLLDYKIYMKVVAHKYHQFTGHNSSVYALASSSSPNVFYSSGGDGMIAQWDMEAKGDGQVIARVNSSVYTLHYQQGRNLLIIAQNNEGLHFLDTLSRKIVGSIKLTNANIFDIKSIGDEVLVAGGDGVLYIVDQVKMAVKQKIKLSSSSLRSISVNKEGDEFAVAASDHRIHIFKGDQVTSFKEHTNSVFKVCFSRDGQRLLSGSRDAQLKFWKMGNGGLVIDESIPAHLFTINDIVFQPGERYFATASKDKTVKIWDYQQRKLIKVIDNARSGGHLSSVNKLIWTSYNNFLISASDDRTICVWDLEFSE